MEQDDYKRQVDWLMGEIKQSCGPKRRMGLISWSVTIILLILGLFAYSYYVNHDNISFFECAIFIGIILCFTIINWIGLKRIERAESKKELLSISRFLRVFEWIYLLVIAASCFFISEDSLGEKIWFLLIFSLCIVGGRMFNKTDTEAHIERLQELVRGGE